MKSQTSLSDIEQILQTQTWKHTKLPPLHQQRKPLKVRSLVDKSTPNKSEIIIKQPVSANHEIHSEDFSESQAANCRDTEGHRGLCNLIIPFLSQVEISSAVSCAKKNSQFQIPVFPKTQFANSSRNLSIVPIFEDLPCALADGFITERKIEVGRIKKNVNRSQRRRFEYLEDLNNIRDEKMLKRRDTIYLSN